MRGGAEEEQAEQVDQQTEASHHHQQAGLLGEGRVGEALGLGEEAGRGVEAEVQARAQQEDAFG